MKLIAKTLYGLEEILAGELRELGAAAVTPVNRAVEFEGDLEMLYSANYNLRTALAILRPLTSFRLKVAKDLYSVASRFNWEDYMTVTQSFSIVPVVHSRLFAHTGYAGLVLKDAIADRFRSVAGRRPFVDQKNPAVVYNLRISENDVTISADSSIIPLFKRGYRTDSLRAPINEVLAAGIIKLSGWDGKRPLLDPMCGSGTIGIEAALMARGTPPGSFRKFYGFMNWPGYDDALFERVKQKSKPSAAIATPVTCYDRSRDAIRTARINIRNAGLDGEVRTGVVDFFESDSGGREFHIVTNPPYGERLEEKDIVEFYSRTGERLKHGYPGSEAWLISSSVEGLKSIGLKPSKRYTLFNGPLESRLVQFELFKGSRSEALSKGD